MGDTLKRVVVDDDTSLDELLTVADDQPVVLVKNGSQYQLARLHEGAERQATVRDLAADRRRLDRVIGAWADLDTDAMIEMLYRARELGSRPADRPGKIFDRD